MAHTAQKQTGTIRDSLRTRCRNLKTGRSAVVIHVERVPFESRPFLASLRPLGAQLFDDTSERRKVAPVPILYQVLLWREHFEYRFGY
jgi:hypothetical protein